MLGGEVEEGEQRVRVLLQRRDRLRVFRAVLGGEPLRGFARLIASLRVRPGLRSTRRPSSPRDAAAFDGVCVIESTQSDSAAGANRCTRGQGWP